MISNEAVQRLIDLDRETLVALMAAAMAAGSFGGSSWDVYQDMDIRALLDQARAVNARPERWGLSRERWNAEMSKL